MRIIPCSFGLSLAGPLDIRTPLFPNTSIEISAPLVTTGIPKAISPMNGIFLFLLLIQGLQVALKSSNGIIYFQTTIPLHVLFTETGMLPQDVWLRMWKTDVPEDNEVSRRILSPYVNNILKHREKLSQNNIFIIAERMVDSMVTF